MRDVVIFAAAVVAAMALFGWGSVVVRLTRLSAASWPLAAGLGLGVVVFLGGLANLAGMARPWTFDAIVVLGLGLSALELRKHSAVATGWRKAAPSLDRYDLLLIAVVVVVGGFVAATVVPPAIFNHHDDFEKYFPQVVRMLATGTVHDNPIGSIGIETLGGQAVLQGFVAGNFPIEYINGADAFFCLLLSLLILAGSVRAQPALKPAMLGGVVALVAVDPHYVNIAGVYSLVALSLVLVAASCMSDGPAINQPRIEPIVGLVYAAQLAIKLTAVSFVGLHFVAWIAATLWLSGNWRFALWRGAKTVLWSVVFLLPWLLLFAPDYVAVLSPPPGSPTMPAAPDHPPQFVLPLTTGTYLPSLWYTVVAALILCCGCGVLLRARRSSSGDRSQARAAAFSAFCVAIAANYIFCVAYVGPYLSDIDGATRYAAPWLIAGIGAVVALGPTFFADARRTAPSPGVVWTFAGIGLAVLLMFSGSLQQRVIFAARYGAPQAYVEFWLPEARQAMAAWVADALHGKLRDQVRDAQSKVPAGSPVLVWMLTPSLLDYGRNPIYEIGWYQLVRPWSLIPQTSYVIWQYSGFVVRQPPEYANLIHVGIPMLARASIAALQFGDRLQRIGQKSEVLYNSDGILVLRISCPHGLAQC